MVFRTVFDRGRAQLGRECYPRGKCVASELGRKHTVGQKKCQLDAIYEVAFDRKICCLICVLLLHELGCVDAVLRVDLEYIDLWYEFCDIDRSLAAMDVGDDVYELVLDIVNLDFD